MISFFKKSSKNFFVVQHTKNIDESDIKKLTWLFNGAKNIFKKQISGEFIGPRKEMTSPWSTNAVEITRNIGISYINRIELLRRDGEFDTMTESKYIDPDQNIFKISKTPEKINFIEIGRAHV